MKLIRRFRVAARRARNFTYSNQFQMATLAAIDHGTPRLIVYGAAGLALGMAAPVSEYREAFTMGSAAAMTIDASIFAARTGLRRATAFAHTLAAARRKRILSEMRANARQLRLAAR